MHRTKTSGLDTTMSAQYCAGQLVKRITRTHGMASFFFIGCPWEFHVARSGIGLAFLLARMAFYVAHVRRYSVCLEPWVYNHTVIIGYVCERCGGPMNLKGEITYFLYIHSHWCVLRTFPMSSISSIWEEDLSGASIILYIIYAAEFVVWINDRFKCRLLVQ